MHKNLSKRIILLGAACENSGNGPRDHMGAVDCGDISYCGLYAVIFFRYWDLNIGGSQPGEAYGNTAEGMMKRQLIMQGILESRNSSQSVLPWRQR